jgi:hypothetical protein
MLAISAPIFPVAAELSWLPQIDFRHGVIELPSL